MTKRLGSWTAAAAMLTLPFLGFGCGSSSSPSVPAAEARIPSSFFGSIEGAASGVAETRKTAADGDRVVLRGMIGGRVDPFVENRAIMVLVDDSLPLCQGCCDTPWDMCCSPAETIREKSVTVQIADAQGQPLRVSLRGQGGLEPASKVVVAGTVRRENDALFVITAERIALAASVDPPACASGCAH